MKKIVLSAMMGLVLTVAMYYIALRIGAKGPTVAAIAFVATFAPFNFVASLATPSTPFTVVVALTTIATLVVFIAVADANTGIGILTLAAMGITLVALLASAVVDNVAEEEQVPVHWAVSAYLVQVLFIWFAIMVDRLGWSMVIVLGGSARLYGLLRWWRKRQMASAALWR